MTVSGIPVSAARILHRRLGSRLDHPRNLLRVHPTGDHLLLERRLGFTRPDTSPCPRHRRCRDNERHRTATEDNPQYRYRLSLNRLGQTLPNAHDLPRIPKDDRKISAGRHSLNGFGSPRESAPFVESSAAFPVTNRNRCFSGLAFDSDGPILAFLESFSRQYRRIPSVLTRQRPPASPHWEDSAGKTPPPVRSQADFPSENR